MKKINFGIIGCGEIAVAQADGISRADNAKISMVMDVSENVAKDLANKHNVLYTTDVKELLNNRDIDAVYIAVPHYLHALLAIQSAEAGKHVLVEKPIAVNLEEADRMIETCNKNKVKLSVCFLMRYWNYSLKIKELLEKKAIGDIIGIKMSSVGEKLDTYWTGGYTGRIKTDWRMSKEKSGGGVLIMNFSHNIDLMRFLTGLEFSRVYSEYDTLNTAVEVEDTIVVTLRFKNNKGIGWIESSTCIRGGESPEGTYTGDRIYGTEGQIIISIPLYIFTKKEVEGLEPNKWNKINLEDNWPDLRKKLTEEFAEAILIEKPVPISGLDGRKSLEVIVSAYESGRIHKPVELPLLIFHDKI